MPALETGSLAKLLELMEVVRQLDSELPAQTLMAFVAIAHAGPDGILQQELGNKLGLSRSAISRNVAVLSEVKGVGLPGLGLIEATILPENRKLRLLRLTAKGRKYAEKLSRFVE